MKNSKGVNNNNNNNNTPDVSSAQVDNKKSWESGSECLMSRDYKSCEVEARQRYNLLMSSKSN